jgi:hypothetical protein
MNEKDDQIAHFGIVPKCLILRQFRNSPWTGERGGSQGGGTVAQVKIIDKLFGIAA